jgi:hypothetical protein
VDGLITGRLSATAKPEKIAGSARLRVDAAKKGRESWPSSATPEDHGEQRRQDLRGDTSSRLECRSEHR